MPPTDPFIPIPSKTKDFRNCTRRLWGAGIDLVSSFDEEWPQGAVGDGAGGQFVLTIEKKQHLRLFHVSASGVRTTPAAPIASIGFASDVRARLVRSSAGSCIVVWCFGNLGDRVMARRFDSDCLPLWNFAADIFPTAAPPRYAMVSAAEDGAGGVVISALRGGQDFLVQRLNTAAQPLWAIPSFSLPAFPSPTTPDTPQIVQTGAGFAVLIQLPVTPTSQERNVLCQRVASGGQLTGGWFTIGVAREQWWSRAGVRRVISDDAGGFWVALSPTTGPLQLLRFASNATAPAVTVTSGSLADVATYAIAPDGSGGVLVAMIEKAGAVTVDRFASTGGRVFRVPFVAPPVSNLPVPDFPQLALSHRVVGIATRDTRDRGNIMVTVQYSPSAGSSRVSFHCLDFNGLPIGVTRTDLGSGLGNQTAAIMTQPPLPTPLTTTGTDFGSVTAAWHTRAASQTQTLSAQKIACCSEVYNVDLVPNPWTYRCAIPVGLERNLPGTLNIGFPCNRGDIGSFGVLPIPHLNMVPGVTLPGGLANKGVRPPGWVRVQFTGVPKDVDITLYSHAGKRVGEAKPLVNGDADSPIRQITFQPDAKLSYALAFTRAGRTEVGDQLGIGVDVTYGDGKPPAMVAHRSRKTKRGKRRTTKVGRRT